MTKFIAIGLLILLPLVAVAGTPGMSEPVGPLYTLGQVDTLDSFDPGDYSKIVVSLSMLRGPSGANDSVVVDLQKSILHGGGGTGVITGPMTKGKSTWKTFYTTKFIATDSAIANWPKWFTVAISDSGVTGPIRPLVKMRDDSDTDTTLTATGVSLMLNARGVRP